MVILRPITLTLLLTALLGSGCATRVSFNSVKLSPDDRGETGRVPGLLSKPQGAGPFPAIVLLHSCGGLRSHITEDWPKFLNGLGYVTLVVDSFGARSISRCSMDLVRNHAGLARDAYGALEHLATLPFVDETRVGVMGFSIGGLTTNYLVSRGIRSPSGRNFRAAVALYSGCSTFGSGGSRPIELSDTMIPYAKIIGDRELHRVIASCTSRPSHPRFELHILKGAYHAFDVSELTSMRQDMAGNPILYSSGATRKAQEITKSFFARHLKRRAR